MATITKGILGGFSGTVGTVVGANWRGKDVIRSRPKPSSKLPSDKQLMQQAKFKLATQFLQPIKGVLNLYFGSDSGARSRANIAVSYTIKEAVIITGGLPEIEFSKVLITKGDLAGFQNLTVTPKTGAELEFNWDDNSLQGNASATDKFAVVIYCVSLNEFYPFETNSLRPDGNVSVTLPVYTVGESVEIYAYFHNEKQTLACNSVAMGSQILI